MTKQLMISVLALAVCVFGYPGTSLATEPIQEVMPNTSSGGATRDDLDQAALVHGTDQLAGPKTSPTVDENGDLVGEVTNIYTENEADTDGDGIPDSQDPDADGDGYLNEEDWYPFNPLFHIEGEYDPTAIPLENSPDHDAQPPTPEMTEAEREQEELAQEALYALEDLLTYLLFGAPEAQESDIVNPADLTRQELSELMEND